MPRNVIRSPLLPPLLTGSLLCDDRGYLRYWATVWRALYGSDLAGGSLDGKLVTIERLYRIAEELFGADRLDEMLATGDVEMVRQVLESFFVRTRNQALLSGKDGAREWEAARTFVTQIIEGIVGAGGRPTLLSGAIMSLPGSAAAKLPAYIAGMRAPEAARKRPVIRALPAEVVVVDDFLDLLEPSSFRNPFRSEDQRWRNYALFLLYLQQGLRRGEALILPAGAVQEGNDPHTGEVCLWMNVDETVDDDEDPRRDPRSCSARISGAPSP
jgi:integrase